VSGIPQVVHDGETGFLLETGDEAGLAEKMRWTLDHPQQTREMGQKALTFAKSFFSSDSYRKGYQKVFDAAQDVLAEDGDG
jgi:glycosyltransferase involved in cell wall biosynthesis